MNVAIIMGIFGASSIERLPTERAITRQVETARKPTARRENSLGCASFGM
jgi:hypothetical protein